MKKQSFLSVCCLTAAVAVSGIRAYAADDTLTVVMNQMQDVQVVAQRVQQTTINHDVVGNDRLNRENTGQNLPYLLSTIPALQVTSDDGLGVGYTYFRVRGTDHTRINMTVNDVPLNDQESQTVFWVNMTDMAASMSSIDVQRGVGTSTNGSASFGASLNMYTGDNDTTNHFTLAFNGGMYNTFREMVSGHVVLPGNWRVNARFSKVNSDGFLYRTNSDLYSYYGDLGWYGDKTQVVARFFGGKEKTGMGWDGVDYNTAYGIDGADRRYNPAGEYEDAEGNTKYYDNQTDNYAQQHAQLQITHRFTPNWSLNATLHYTHGGGYYEQYKRKKIEDWGLEPYTDVNGKTVKKAYGMYRKFLDNHFAGAIVSAKYVNEHVDVQFGAAGNDYIGAHFGTLNYIQDSVYGGSLPINYEYYRNNANKVDANTYGKVNWRVLNRGQERLSLYADLQYRYVRYHRDGINDENMTDLPLTVNYHFFNPKAGLTYQNRGHLLYGSFAMANREPSRDNYKENVFWDAQAQEYKGLPSPETLYDYELGYQYSHPRFAIGANLYFMDYDNQLVLTGDYNEVGAMRTTNVKDSYRMGIELTAGVKITDWFRWDGNFVLSRNKIQNYEQYVDIYEWDDAEQDYVWADYDTWIFKETTIAFSPMITAMSLFTFDVAGFVGTVQTNVVSKQYLDNTMRESAMLKAYTTTNVNLQYTLPLQKYKHCPDIKLLCQINNIFDHKYASNGGADASALGDETHPWPWYYAQAGINVHAGFVVNW
ncbi:MAG: TonB-dependent receptor [Paludibacteraceae bacterium]